MGTSATITTTRRTDGPRRPHADRPADAVRMRPGPGAPGLPSLRGAGGGGRAPDGARPGDARLGGRVTHALSARVHHRGDDPAAAPGDAVADVPDRPGRLAVARPGGQ